MGAHCKTKYLGSTFLWKGKNTFHSWKKKWKTKLERHEGNIYLLDLHPEKSLAANPICAPDTGHPLSVTGLPVNSLGHTLQSFYCHFKLLGPLPCPSWPSVTTLSIGSQYQHVFGVRPSWTKSRLCSLSAGWLWTRKISKSQFPHLLNGDSNHNSNTSLILATRIKGDNAGKTPITAQGTQQC